MAKHKDSDYNRHDISEEQFKSLARCLLPEIQRFYESAEGRMEFDEWRVRQATIAGKEKYDG